MTSATAISRLLARRLAPILALLSLVTLFAVGTHHHDEGLDHVCAVCTVGHSPAVAAAVFASLPSPCPDAGRPHARAQEMPRPVRLAAALGRSPPRS